MGRDNINVYRWLCVLIVNNRNDFVCVFGEEFGGFFGVWSGKEGELFFEI